MKRLVLALLLLGVAALTRAQDPLGWEPITSIWTQIDGSGLPVGAVDSVDNADGSLAFSPTTGNVLGSIVQNHDVAWSTTETFNNEIVLKQGTNAHDTLAITRKTDTSPTGTYIIAKNAAGTTLYKVNIDGSVVVVATAGITLQNTGNGGSTGLRPNAAGTSVNFVLPGADGAANTLLKTDGSGNLGFVPAFIGDTGGAGHVGTATLASGVATVSTTAVTASSIIILTCNTPKTAAGCPALFAKTADIVPGTSFKITSGDLTDSTSTVNWAFVN